MAEYLLGNLITSATRVKPYQNAVSYENIRLSWSDVLIRVQQIAGALNALEAQAGERIAVLALNSADYFCLYFAIPWMGGITVPINTRLTSNEVSYWVNDSNSTILFVDDNLLEIADSIRDDCPSVKHYVYIGEGQCPDNMCNLQQLILQSTPTIEQYHDEQQQIATIFYTGGSTGQSKGVMLTHQGLIYNTLQWVQTLSISSREILLIGTPMFHMVAATNCIGAAMSTAELLIIPKFEPKVVLSAIGQHRITKAALVPVMVDMLVSDPEFPQYDLSSLSKVSYGGAPMPEDIIIKAKRLMPQTRFYQIYGQTESGGMVSCLHPEYHTLEGARSEKLQSAGTAVIGTEIAIFGENAQEVVAGEIGEICLRSPSLTPGYWGNAAKIENLYLNGWLHTGDIGYLDEDGFLYVVDRIKDMIVSGGENVYATEVEGVLYELSEVLQCAVIGIPSRKWGEQVHAVIKLPKGCCLSETDIMAHCKKRLASYKQVRSFEFTHEDLPMSAMNKILKRELRKPYWEKLNVNI